MDKNLLANIALDAYIDIFDQLIKTNALDLGGLDKIISFRISEGKDIFYSISQNGINKLNGKQKADIACLFLDVKQFFQFLNGKRQPLFIKGLRLYKKVSPLLDAVADHFALGVKCEKDCTDVLMALYKNIVIHKLKTDKKVEISIGDNIEGEGIIVAFHSEVDMINMFKGKLLFDFVEGKYLRISAENDYDLVLESLKSIGVRDFI